MEHQIREVISSGTSQQFSGSLCTIPFLNHLFQGLLQANIALYDVKTGFAAHNQRGNTADVVL
ncbi:Uncharacterised protein [Klebsiella aerogenes]|nr:Uncharacterised protein [Klebsiella aerogenes]